MMDRKRFHGTLTALATPFLNGELDLVSLGKLVDSQIENSIDGFVVAGTTGEGPTLTTHEKKKIFELVKNKSAGLPVIVGTGTNCTRRTIEQSKEAESLGADAVLVVVPYYNKPPQRGLLEHFRAVARAIEIPVILYNVPGRTVASLAPETICALSAEPNIIGIKEATGDIDLAQKIKNQVGPDFVMLSGDDLTYEDFLAVGGHGVISVASHVIPKEMKRGKTKEYKGLIQSLFVEANPIPVKWALRAMSLFSSSECRLPLCELDPKFHEQIFRELKELRIVQ